jgi:hypothetical protein
MDSRFGARLSQPQQVELLEIFIPSFRRIFVSGVLRLGQARSAHAAIFFRSVFNSCFIRGGFGRRPDGGNFGCQTESGLDRFQIANRKS